MGRVLDALLVGYKALLQKSTTLYGKNSTPLYSKKHIYRLESKRAGLVALGVEVGRGRCHGARSRRPARWMQAGEPKISISPGTLLSSTVL